MKIQIDKKYRLAVKSALIIIPILSIIISFFSLPTILALITSSLFVLVPFVMNQLVFQYKVMHVMPIPDNDDVVRYALGTSWFAEEIDTLSGLGLSIIYKYRETAKDSYSLLKSWNYGKVIDQNANITLSIVIEGNDKYSLFIYPGNRDESLNNTKSLVEAHEGPNAETKIAVMKFHFQFCHDYSNDELKKKIIGGLPYVKELLLNVAYVKNDEVIMYSKKGFRLQRFFFQERSSLEPGTIEYANTWSDLASKEPEIHKAAAQRINKKLRK